MILLLFAFGGAGPLHSVALAKELGIPKVLVPMRPGITNAVGCVVADVRHDYVNSINMPLAQAEMDQVDEIFCCKLKLVKQSLKSEGVEIEELIIVHDVDMQFQGTNAHPKLSGTGNKTHSGIIADCI